jgi:hypothetical protein
MNNRRKKFSIGIFLALPNSDLIILHKSEGTTKNTKEWDELSNCVIGRAIEVSRCLGPALSDSAYKPLQTHQHKGGIQRFILESLRVLRGNMTGRYLAHVFFAWTAFTDETP